MNPIEFCRLPGYHSTIFLTYSFDPLFFERIVLGEIRASQKGNVVVVADQGQLAQAQEGWDGQVVGLGSKYQLYGYASSASFHPKLIIRFGSQAGAVWTGSANLTFGGWSVNQELGAAWEFGADRNDRGSWIGPVIRSLMSEGITSMNSVLMDRISRERWLDDLQQGSEDEESSLVTNFDGGALATKLAQRWQGRRFTRVKITTGSTDRSGAWLRRLHDLFGITDAIVLTEGGRCSFEPDELARLPIDVAVSTTKSELPRPMHAKFYWFDGPDGPAAAFGSANCSAAAWLNGPDSGGNHESLVIYDSPDQEDFADVLRLFDEELDAIDLKAAESLEHEKPAAQKNTIRVVSAGWEAVGAPLVIHFNRPLDNAATATARLADTTVNLSLAGNDGVVWVAKGIIDWSRAETPFVEITIVFPEGEAITLKVWVDSYEQLRQAEQGDDFKNTFDDMRRSPTSDKQRDILKRLHKISSAILTDFDLFSDPQYLKQVSERPASEKDEKKDTTPLDPANLIRSMRDIDIEREREESGPHNTGQMSVLGVMRSLYEIGRRDLLEEETEYDDSWDGDGTGGAQDTKGKKKKSDKPKMQAQQDPQLIDEKHQERLRKQTTEFLVKLSSKDFAEATSATQLVQAAAYPVALAVFSVRDGWATEEIAQDWCRQAFDTLFRRQYPGKKFGLIEFVAARYEEQGQEAVVRQILGDGTLWFALLAAVNEFSWQGPNEWIEKAFVLRDIFRSDNLVANTGPGRLRSLFDSAQQLKLEEALNLAPPVDELMQKLEQHLAANFDGFIADQREFGSEFTGSDLMWRHNAGWGVYSDAHAPKDGFIMIYLHRRATERPVKEGFFVNVSLLRKGDSDVDKYLSGIEELCTGQS